MSNQLAKKWTAKDSRPLTLLDGGVGRTLCANGLPTEEGSLFRKIWSAAALGVKYLLFFSTLIPSKREKNILVLLS